MTAAPEEGADAERAAAERVEAARAALADNPTWYHAIELAPGVVTPGQVDWRASAGRVLPPSLAGQRALDVGTFDGFWAFELERRGAEVVAIDTATSEENEWPPLKREALRERLSRFELDLGRGYRLAAEVLGSRARHEVCNVYDLTPAAIGGPVDVVFSGSILLHLRDPVRALERMRDVLVPGGRLLVLEPFSLRASLLSPRRALARFEATTTDFNWWYPNLAALRAWLVAAGMEQVARSGTHRPATVGHMARRYAAFEARRPQD